MKAIKRDDKNLEVQAVPYGGSVLLHLPDQRRLLVETSLLGDVMLSVIFGDSFKGIPVFDENGDELTTLIPGAS